MFCVALWCFLWFYLYVNTSLVLPAIVHLKLGSISPHSFPLLQPSTKPPNSFRKPPSTEVSLKSYANSLSDVGSSFCVFESIPNCPNMWKWLHHMLHWVLACVELKFHVDLCTWCSRCTIVVSCGPNLSFWSQSSIWDFKIQFQNIYIYFHS